MSRRTFSGREVLTVLRSHGFEPVGGSGSRRKLAYVHSETGEKRVVVPLHDELATGALASVAEQAGAKDIDAFRAWLEQSLRRGEIAL